MNEPMTRRRFVAAIAEIAIDEVVAGEVDVLRHPPGRRPPVEVRARSEWFIDLDPETQSMVLDIVRSAAYGAVHRVLAALDGATPISDRGDEGRLQLLWRTADDVTDLTDPAGEVDLHDLLSEIKG